MWSNSRTPNVCTKFWSSCVRHVQIWIMLPLPTRLARTSISVNKQKRKKKIENYSTEIFWSEIMNVHIEWVGSLWRYASNEKKYIHSNQDNTQRVRTKIVEKLHLCGWIFLVLFSRQFSFFLWNSIEFEWVI